MTTAMMLPTSLPLIALFQTLTRQRRDQGGLIGLLLAGYLIVWTLFGAALFAGDWLLHRAVEGTPWLADQAWAISALTLILAGVYQFTPLKYYCLDKCRSPLSFISGHWHGRNAPGEALVLGAHHGLFCVGCCWTLMLLMFAVGAGNLGWMLDLGTVMAVEKNTAWGRRASRPLGIVLLMMGAASLLVGLFTR
jgi:predicted metal-binding membrane protein